MKFTERYKTLAEGFQPEKDLKKLSKHIGKTVAAKKGPYTYHGAYGFHKGEELTIKSVDPYDSDPGYISVTFIPQEPEEHDEDEIILYFKNYNEFYRNWQVIG